MKKWISLFDLCPVRPGTHKDRAARITAMSYLRNCQDKEQHMERQLLNTGEYILLRGKDSYNGLLQRVETNLVSRITGQAIVDLYNSVPKSHRKNAVFLIYTYCMRNCIVFISQTSHSVHRMQMPMRSSYRHNHIMS